MTTKPTIEDLAERHARKRMSKKQRNAELRGFGYDPDGEDGQNYRKIFHRAIMEGGRVTVALWLFPEEDFEAWRDSCHEGGPVTSYAEYARIVRAAEADAKARGHVVEILALRVAEMLAELRRRGWANTSENRSRIIAGGAGSTLGIKIEKSAIGTALIGSEPVESNEVALRAGETHDEAIGRVLRGDVP